MECGVVCIRNMDNDSSRQIEIRSHGNVGLQKDGENQMAVWNVWNAHNTVLGLKHLAVCLTV